jgi:hypothetical protein
MSVVGDQTNNASPPRLFLCESAVIQRVRRVITARSKWSDPASTDLLEAICRLGISNQVNLTVAVTFTAAPNTALNQQHDKTVIPA